MYRILCIKFSQSQFLIPDGKNITFLLVKVHPTNHLSVKPLADQIIYPSFHAVTQLSIHSFIQLPICLLNYTSPSIHSSFHPCLFIHPASQLFILPTTNHSNPSNHLATNPTTHLSTKPSIHSFVHH